MKTFKGGNFGNSRSFSVLSRYPDGDEVENLKSQHGIPPYQICFHIFGNIFLRDALSSTPIDNPFQSDKQREMYQWKLARDLQDIEAERNAREGYFGEGSYQDGPG
jgi:hypothetical protein